MEVSTIVSKLVYNLFTGFTWIYNLFIKVLSKVIIHLLSTMYIPVVIPNLTFGVWKRKKNGNLRSSGPVRFRNQLSGTFADSRRLKALGPWWWRCDAPFLLQLYFLNACLWMLLGTSTASPSANRATEALIKAAATVAAGFRWALGLQRFLLGGSPDVRCPEFFPNPDSILLATRHVRSRRPMPATWKCCGTKRGPMHLWISWDHPRLQLNLY